MTSFEDIQALLPEGTSKQDIDLIQKAYEFAKEAHKEHKRFSGEPYFTHLEETAKTLIRYEMDAQTIAAGFLHDTIEDTDITEEEMKKEFGEEITNLIKGVTKLGKIKYRGHVRSIESLRKFLIALADDYRVLIIKLADRLHNLQTLEHVREDKQKRIALESIEVYAPLADRLGIGRFKGEIEDAAFKYAYPAEYAETIKILKERAGDTTESLHSIYNKLKEELDSSHVQVTHVDYRIKHAYSLWKKLQKYNMNIDKIYDIVALRVVVSSVEDCYYVLGLIHSLWKPLPGRIKDYIALPKTNGYQSLHTTIFTGDGCIAEIQIRTEEMHAQAEYGIASHYSYKESNEKNGKKFEWVENLKEVKNIGVKSPQDLLKQLKADYLNNRIFVFTPKGDVLDLPEESTPVDFAYAIHSEIGDHIAGVKVNGKMAPLDTKLNSSDIVEVQTKKEGSPSLRWLYFVKTALAKKQIRNYVKEHKSENLLYRVIPKKYLD